MDITVAVKVAGNHNFVLPVKVKCAVKVNLLKNLIQDLLKNFKQEKKHPVKGACYFDASNILIHLLILSIV